MTKTKKQECEDRNVFDVERDEFRRRLGGSKTEKRIEDRKREPQRFEELKTLHERSDKLQTSKQRRAEAVRLK